MPGSATRSRRLSGIERRRMTSCRRRSRSRCETRSSSDVTMLTIGRPTPGFSHGLQVDAFSIDPHHPKVVWVTTRLNGVFRSADGGRTWMQYGLQHRYVNYVQADPRSTDHAYVGEYGLVSRALNNSRPATYMTKARRAWTLLRNLPGEWQFAASARSDTVYAWHGRRILETTDQGRTWQTLALLPRS
jgi:hypothetical protein